MITSIFSREVLYRLQRPLTWFVLLLMIYQGIVYSTATYDRIINEGVWLNAAAVAHINQAGIGFLLFIVIAIITGSALHRDLEHRTAALLYTCPVNEKRFFLERFAAAFAINVLLGLGYIAGMLLMPWLPGSSGAPVGPAPLGQMAWNFALFMLPNLFLLTALSLALVVIFRQVTASYIGMAVLMVLLLLTEFVREHTPYLNLVLLLDPLGYGISMETVIAMGVAEKTPPISR
ncbi:hypothetical protein CAI21_16930 [Alkalilimnicola ehrlichii]|uniref:ABC transporter permease n=1 Tax=Alkalilimnicola ehrlichii TaxID=351052 RepID=A0A3E0WN07_9GAMM|nr:hypothetical protein [Alkalilimnicola ehrlichii]RFA26375.1 hypothetical protein CAI21_16930 [Alkalilimnicola ehrlichii]RFA33437.1 hypothetical protein CAL65_17410 [Alkalilimnicola ehrlichii]